MTTTMGWNLPPGVTDADIDRAAGADDYYDECRVCGEPINVAELCDECAKGNDPFGPTDPNAFARDKAR